MVSRERLGVGLVAAGVVLGAAGDVLFHGRPLGINALVFAALFACVLTALLRLGRVPLHQGRRVMVAPLVLFSGLLAWHASPLLIATNLLAVAGAVSLGALRRTVPRLRDAEVSDYIVGAAAAGAASFAGGIELMEREVPWRRLATALRARPSATVARGLAMGVPLLLVFGWLFAAADPVFRGFLGDAVPAWRSVFVHLAVAAVVGWLCAGLLRDLLAAREQERFLTPAFSGVNVPRPRLGPGEAAVALAAVDVLFLAFVVVQLRYLFGGHALVAARTHLTYAQYARQGFFELVAVGVLVFVLLVAVDALTKRAGRRRLPLRLASATLIGLALVVMASALERMYVYEQAYGLTELRIYATGVILWVGAVLVLLGFTALRGSRRAFATGAVIAGLAATLALNAVNPDALIVRTNLSRSNPDLGYLAGLSSDAVPALLQRLPSLRPAERRRLAARLLSRRESAGGILGWNASRSAAERALRADRAELLRLRI